MVELALRRYLTYSLLPVIAWVSLLVLLELVTHPLQVGVLVGLALLLDAHVVPKTMVSFMLVVSSNMLIRLAFGVGQNPLLDAAFASAFVMFFASREEPPAVKGGGEEPRTQDVDLRRLLLEGEEKLRAFLPERVVVTGSLFSTTILGCQARGVMFRLASPERVIATIVIHNHLPMDATQALQAEFRQEVEPVVSHPLDQHPRFDRMVEDLAHFKYLKPTDAHPAHERGGTIVSAPARIERDERNAA